MGDAVILIVLLLTRQPIFTAVVLTTNLCEVSAIHTDSILVHAVMYSSLTWRWTSLVLSQLIKASIVQKCKTVVAALLFG